MDILGSSRLCSCGGSVDVLAGLVGKLSGHFGRSFLCSKGVIVDLLGRSGLCSGEAGWTYWEGLDNEWGA